MLFDDWHPVTRDFGLINAPVDACVASLQSWRASIGARYASRQISSSFGDALNCLPPLTAERRRTLFVSTSSGWTAFFESGIQGSDPFPVMSMLAKLLGVVGMRVCAARDGATWSAVIWEVYAPPELGGEPPLCYRRSVCAAKSDGGRWVFHQYGEPFAFERIENYTLTRKRDRFPRELLIEYLAHFGLAPFEDRFYVVSDSSPAVVLDIVSRGKPSAPEFTLEQVLAGAPWKR
jgi:hypothetical protein